MRRGTKARSNGRDLRNPFSRSASSYARCLMHFASAKCTSRWVRAKKRSRKSNVGGNKNPLWKSCGLAPSRVRISPPAFLFTKMRRSRTAVLVAPAFLILGKNKKQKKKKPKRKYYSRFPSLWSRCMSAPLESPAIFTCSMFCTALFSSSTCSSMNHLSIIMLAWSFSADASS